MRNKEKRKYIRLRAHHLVKYRLLVDGQAASPFAIAPVQDIGAGGICFNTEEHLPISGLIELKINFPAVSTPIPSLAKIIWIKQKSRARRYEIGAQFVDIEQAIRKIIEKRIDSAVDRLQKKSRFWSLF